MADLTHDSHDDGFHEIQLSGKQLVFLFMATTVFSVVIFLVGVLVGRNVQAEGIGGQADAMAEASEPLAAVPLPAEPVAETPAPELQLDYARQLEGQKRPEKLKPVEEDSVPVREEIPPPRVEAPPVAAEAAPAAAPPADAAKDRSTPAPEPSKAPAAKPESGPRPGTWAVQVISLSERAAAMQVVQRLQKKGYPAYLLSPAPGAPTRLYKVQVGRYRDEAAARKVEARLKKEEKFDTWIVR